MNSQTTAVGKRLSLLVLMPLCIVAAAGCGQVTSTVHESDNRANYKNIFHEDVPPDVNVVNSMYVTYQPSFRLMVITTPDYEIELIATKQWIEKKIKKLWLQKTQASWERQAQHYIEQRAKERGREWYMPKDVSEYESYLDAASVPFIHLLVDKTPVSDNRYRVYMSKH